MVVVTMDLSGLSFPTDGYCALSFEARSDSNGALIVNLPEPGSTGAPKKNRSEWMQIGDTFWQGWLLFRRDPAVNQGEVSFFFDQEQLKEGGRYEFKRSGLVNFE